MKNDDISKRVRKYFSRANWAWEGLPDTDELVNEFEISRDKFGKMRFELGIDEAEIAAIGAAQFAEWALDGGQCYLAAIPEESRTAAEEDVFEFVLGPFLVTFSRPEIESLLSFSPTKGDEVLYLHKKAEFDG